MKMTCYALGPSAPKLVPAQVRRDWMDAYQDPRPYRCLPLAIANSYGWNLLCPAPLEITWTGGPKTSDLAVRALKPLPDNRPVSHVCMSNFARGIVTFIIDYIFQTEPGWEMIATGPANSFKDGAAPLTGLIETDWLAYPFSMNWQLTRPGTIRFEEDEPFCCVFPVAKGAVSGAAVEIRDITDNPELNNRHLEHRRAREDLYRRRDSGDPEAIKQAWLRHYFLGRHADGSTAGAENHESRLRAGEPLDFRKKP